MTELLTGVNIQPGFPREDLTDANAGVLEFMMANQEIMNTSHRAAEQVVWSFKVGHAAISRSIPKVYDETNWQSAINHGVTTFEAITAMVGGENARSSSFPVNTQAVNLVNLPAGDLRNHCEEAMDEFWVHVPRTAEVVRASSARFYGALVTYAVLGAAMSWQFERDIDTL